MAKLLWRRYKWKQFTYWNTECMTILDNKFQLFPCSQRMLVNVTAKCKLMELYCLGDLGTSMSAKLLPVSSWVRLLPCRVPFSSLPSGLIAWCVCVSLAVMLVSNLSKLRLLGDLYTFPRWRCMHSTQKMFMELWDRYWCMTFHLWRIMVPDLALQCQDPWGWGWLPLLSWQ